MADNKTERAPKPASGAERSPRQAAGAARTPARPEENRSGGLPRPDQIKAYLDKYVIGQDEAKKVLSVAVYNHYKRIAAKSAGITTSLDKSNVVLLGETGCGKTYLVKTIAEYLKVPFYLGSATSLTASGYVGDDIESLLSGLLMNCNYDIESAQRGIIFIDEVDKIAKKDAGVSITRDVSGECVQQGLLKMVEGHRMGVQPYGGRKHPEQPLLYVDTTDILFVISGAFVGLDAIVEKRLGRTGKIGFEGREREDTEGSPLRYVTPQDLRTFGMIPEFVGRFPVIANVDPLSDDDLVRILREPKNSLVKQYSEMLALDGVRLRFTEDAVREIARFSSHLGTGARGLRAVMETVMIDSMYESPKMKEGTRITITADMVKERMTNKFGDIVE